MVGSIIKKFLLFFLIFFIYGCSTIYNPATKRNEFILINSDTEAAIGKNMVPQLLRESPLLKDQDVQKRAQRIGRNIAFVSHRKDINYEFYVLDDKELNAVTLPGGYIFVNKGLMDALNDDELAFVLGHEAGHVAARHIAKKIQANMAYQAILAAAFASIGDKSAAAAENIAGPLNTAYNLIYLSYSRQDELDADKLGVEYAMYAGYNPYAAITSLEKLKKKGVEFKIFRYFRTHPYVDERIKILKEYLPGFTSGKTALGLSN